jgi:hypothetical protein
MKITICEQRPAECGLDPGPIQFYRTFVTLPWYALNRALTSKISLTRNHKGKVNQRGAEGGVLLVAVP